MLLLQAMHLSTGKGLLSLAYATCISVGEDGRSSSKDVHCNVFQFDELRGKDLKIPCPSLSGANLHRTTAWYSCQCTYIQVT